MVADRTLLIVEDDPPTARAMVRHFSRIGFEVSLAPTVASALAVTGTFDVAVLDLLLPDGDGVDLAECLMRDGITDTIVFYTGTTDQRILVGRSAQFVPKQDGLETLGKVVAREMQRRDRAIFGSEKD